MGSNLYPSSPDSSRKHEYEHQQDMDTLLANAGYSVKASELAHVATRLERLESFICTAQEAGISHLSSEAIHYNPSDLAGWVETMIGELAPTTSIVNTDYPGSTSSSINSLDYNQVLHDAQAKHQIYAGGSLPLHENCYSVFSRYGESCDEELEEFNDGKTSLNSLDLGYIHSSYDAAFPDEGHNDVNGFSSNNLAFAKSNLQHMDVLTTPASAANTHNPYPLHHHQQAGLDGPTQYCTPYHPIMKHQHHQSDTFSGTQISHTTQSNFILHPDDVQCPDQESGIRLVHLLMACARAVQDHKLNLAHEMVNEIRVLAYPHTNGAMAKVAAFFMEALARRIYSSPSPQECQEVQQGQAISDLLYYHFYETCPYLKFAHFTANQAILEAFHGQKYVHVIDFSLMQGLQWPALIQALALRAGGPPHLRLTGIGPPQPNDKDVLQEMGMKIAQFADSVNVNFDFRGIVAAKLDDVKPWMFCVRQGETVAVNSVLQLHRLLVHAEDPTCLVLPIDEVLQTVKSLRPKVLTLVEQEAEHNGMIFEERFMQALQYYCTMFDSLEACKLAFQSDEIALAEMYLGKEIVNIVACEGKLRVERHETLCQWRTRMEGAGFRPLHLGSNAFKQARMLLNLFSGEGYTVQEDHGCLTLGWHSLPLISASSWQCD